MMKFQFYKPIGLLVALGMIQIVAVPSAFAASEYARQCEQTIGVPVPDVDCSDPNGSSVPVGQRQGGNCDRPSHGLSACNPGTRFIKYTDTFTRNGREETVTTMFMCRKTNGDMARAGGATDNIYSDIGIIQYNETKHATCWFSKTSQGQRPTEVVNGRSVYPSPSTETAPGFWGNHQPESRCINCHQSGVWLRTPFAMGVQDEPNKGYQRTGRRGAYGPGSGNAVPDNNETTAKRGLSCAVGKPDWNRPDGESAPIQAKINQTAYDELFPPPAAPEGVTVASSGYCTSCHYLGVGAGNMTCGTFLGEFRGGPRGLLREGASFSAHYWMPPSSTATTEAEYQQQFGRALDAVSWCCSAANRNHDKFDEICSDSKFGRQPRPGPRGDEDRVLAALAVRGPCALCPDCVPVQGRGGAPKGPGGQPHAENIPGF